MNLIRLMLALAGGLGAYIYLEPSGGQAASFPGLDLSSDNARLLWAILFAIAPKFLPPKLVELLKSVIERLTGLTIDDGHREIVDDTLDVIDNARPVVEDLINLLRRVRSELGADHELTRQVKAAAVLALEDEDVDPENQ